jgi:2,4-dienoyl-CoA reductase (NADPH2)
MPDVTLTPKEMTIEDIEQVIAEFSSAAKRSKEAGFDMVELHGATGYLITQFISPITNKRTDQYGGNVENRLRLPLEILKGVKDAAGRDFPVGIRFVADDFLPGGFSSEDAKVFAKKLEQGGIAYISITGGVLDSKALPEVQQKMQEKGSLADLASEIKGAVDVPVFAGNRISSPDVAEEIISSGKADAVALGRPLLRDPEYPKKAADGRPEEISECIACAGCLGLVMKGKRVHCVQIHSAA